MNLKWTGIALMASLGLAQSQTGAAAKPKFEVISIKPNKSPNPCQGLLRLLPGGRFVANNVPLMGIIAAAWDLPLQTQRLALASGVRMPDEIYDIEANPEAGAFAPGLATEARVLRMRLMMQALLEDRFGLRIRRESKEEPVYALVVAKGGLKLEKSKFQEPKCTEETGPKFFSNPACHWLDGGQDAGLHGGSVTIPFVTEYLNGFTDRPLLDKTGLTDFYDVQTDGWAPMKVAGPQSCEASISNSDRPTLFQIFEKLGLRMESQKAVVEMFVIDHVERPSAN